MTNDNNSLLANLAWKLTNQTETLATEALGHILSTSDEAKDALLGLVRNAGAHLGEVTRVRTEVVGKKNERVDLVCYGNTGEERLPIEVKFWATLTDNQPNTYLDRLPDDDKAAVLLFIAPQARLESLWPEILRRTDSRFNLKEESGAESVKSALLGTSQRRLMLTSWRALLDMMLRTVGDVPTAENIRQLEGLCNTMDASAFLPLGSDELGPSFSRRFTDLHRVFGDVYKRADNEGVVSLKGLGAANSLPRYIGRYINLANTYVWFGMHFEIGAQYRETPLWLAFGWDEVHSPTRIDVVRRALKPLMNQVPPEAIDRSVGDILVPIHLLSGVEYDAVINDIVARLQEIAAFIKGATP